MHNLFVLLYGKLDRFLGRVINHMRLLRLRLLGARIGTNVRVYGRFIVIGYARNLTIGNGSTINHGVFLNLRAPIHIGEGVHLSPYCQLQTGALKLSLEERTHTEAPIEIENQVWIASGAIVTAGVRIGQGSIVGANSVVNRDVPPLVLVGGVPARILKKLEKVREDD